MKAWAVETECAGKWSIASVSQTGFRYHQYCIYSTEVEATEIIKDLPKTKWRVREVQIK